VLEAFALIHSLDRYRLAERLSRLALETGRTARVLVQVNMAGEAAKQGVPPGETLSFLREAAALPGLDIRGLMAMAPFSPDPEDSRPCFRAMRDLFDTLKVPGAKMEILSMGMSGDFEVAVEEGATLLRIGSLIFLPESND
jgi:PLP dependent protein